MIRTYYLTVEGERDEILECHGRIMNHLRSLPGKKLSATISFDERNMRKELLHGAVTVAGQGGTLALEGAKKSLKYLKEAMDL